MTVAELRPALVLVGHGPPPRDPQQLARAAEAWAAVSHAAAVGFGRGRGRV